MIKQAEAAMVRKKKRILVLSWIFGITEMILGFLIHMIKMDLRKYFAFGAILLAGLFAFLFYCDENSYRLIQIGLIFTVCADLLLVLLEVKNKLPAMCSFSVTQLAYAALLYFRDRRFGKIHLAVRGCTVLIALLGTMLVLGEGTDALSLVSLFYFANLFVNVIWAFIEWKESRFLAIGLLLFAFCDICIGFSVMDSLYISLPKDTLLHFLANPGFNLAWVFYIPAQTLIALSLAENKLKTYRKGAASFSAEQKTT